MTRDVKQAKVYKGLYDAFSLTAHERVVKKLDKKYNPIRVQKKAMKHPAWVKIIDDLKIANFIDDDLAQLSMMNVFTFIIFAFLVVMIFAGWIYAYGVINSSLLQVGYANDANPPATSVFPCLDDQTKMCNMSGYVNMTKAAQDIFSTSYASIKSLRMVAVVYILALAIVIIVTNSLVKVNPFWFFFYFIVALFAVMFSPLVSNAYLNVLSTNVYDGELANFTVANWLLLNLPLLVLVISVLGGIFMFINIVRTGMDTGGQL